MNYPIFISTFICASCLGRYKKDCGTSWYGESLYRFIPRAFFTGYVKAYRALELKTPEGKDNSNEKSCFLSLDVSTYKYSYIRSFWWKSFIAFVSISLVCIFSIEVAEYIQHYGLLRRKVSENRYEKMRAQFAWQSYSDYQSI